MLYNCKRIRVTSGSLKVSVGVKYSNTWCATIFRPHKYNNANTPRSKLDPSAADEDLVFLLGVMLWIG